MSDPDLTSMSLEELDEFAAWAHAAENTEGVRILTDDEDDLQQDAPHGVNLELRHDG